MEGSNFSYEQKKDGSFHNHELSDLVPEFSANQAPSTISSKKIIQSMSTDMHSNGSQNSHYVNIHSNDNQNAHSYKALHHKFDDMLSKTTGEVSVVMRIRSN